MSTNFLNLHKYRLNAQIQKTEEFDAVSHPNWDVVAMYIIDTRDYIPESTMYDKGLEMIYVETIPLCADLSSEDWFYEEVHNCITDIAEECELDKVEPGVYRCVCGISIRGYESRTYDSTEYDVETIPYLISRTRLSHSDIEFYKQDDPTRWSEDVI